MQVLQQLDRFPRGVIIGVSVALVIVIAAIDAVTGPDLSFHIFYLVPVLMTGWAAGAGAGAALAAVSALGWHVADTLGGHVYKLALTPYWNLGVRFLSFVLVSTLLAALRKSWNHERELARTDDLTGVHNARSFNELADAELRRARRYSRSLTMAYVDLDDFKTVNDSLGHSAGDDVLRAAAQAMSRSLRAVDIVARLGGDEFGVLLPETDPELAERVILKVHRAIIENTAATGYPITASVGAITYRHLPDSVDDLIRIADDRMYDMKRSGKNRVHHEIIDREMVTAS